MRVFPIINIPQQEKYMDSKPIDRSKSEQTWECEICSFKNIALLPACEMCESKKPGSLKKDDEPMPESGFECHSCKHFHSELKSRCVNCGVVMIPDDSDDSDDENQDKPDLPPEKPLEKRKLIECSICGFENDPENSECVSCESSLQSLSLPIGVRLPCVRSKKSIKTLPKTKTYRGRGHSHRSYGASQCQYCGMNKSVPGMNGAHDICPKMPLDELQLVYKTIKQSYCSFCYTKFSGEEKETHEKSCKSREQFFSGKNPTFDRVSRLQKETMIYMHEKSEKFHWLAEQYLIERIKKLGYKASDLQNLHHYLVNNAPIIIHMHANNHMQFFVKDTHYRNQFETQKSSGSLSTSSRVSWENRMFDGKHNSASPFERVKYGTINFTNDPKGVRACSSYGQSYFLLKPHVRNRCTFTDMDSSSPSSTIGTFQFSYHVLNKLPDAELKAAFDGSKANEVASHVIASYKQIQIHGPVEFKRDIERVYINKAQLADPKIQDMVKEFCKNNDLEYEVFEYENILPNGAGIIGGGLFGVPAMPVSSPASLFPPVRHIPPVPRPSTSHLFGHAPRGRVYVPPPVPRIIVEDDEEPVQGVDYI